MSNGRHSVEDLRLNVGYGSDRGLRREINEDSLLARHPIYAVADGMGGHEAGEVASRVCVESLANNPELAEAGGLLCAADLQRALELADAAIRVATDERAGTTVSGVALVLHLTVPSWLFFNVGDSRAYRFANGHLEQVTVDHSEVQELVELGHISSQEARYHPRRHVVTRALGLGTATAPDFWLMPVEDGDRILLCSDGLTGEVPDEQLAEILRTAADPQEASTGLIQAALRSGGRDNITVVVLDADLASAPEAPEAPECGSTVTTQ